MRRPRQQVLEDFTSLSQQLTELARLVEIAERPSRDLDRLIWQTVDPASASIPGGVPPFFTDDPHASKLLLPDSALMATSKRDGSGFLSTVIMQTGNGQATIEAHHRHRFLAACLAALRARAASLEDREPAADPHPKPLIRR